MALEEWAKDHILPLRENVFKSPADKMADSLRWN
jgi:hypothetical protein